MKKRFTEEQILQILREGEKAGAREEVCRQHGIAEQTYWRWKRKYQGMNPDKVHQLKSVERENERLKKLIANYALANEALKELLEKKGWK